MKYPIAMCVGYGPDDRTLTKIVATVIPSPEAKPGAMKRWVGTKVATDPKVEREMNAFFRANGVRTKLTVPGVFGCPHEEGEDFPEGDDCPFCPFWKGKQGSGAEVDVRWQGLRGPIAEDVSGNLPPES